MYADVIIDISHEQIDRPFQYRIPEDLKGHITVGEQVIVPFGRGNKHRRAYVIGFSEQPEIDPSFIKDIYAIDKKTVAAEQHMITLAAWMRREYGSTMIQALKTVMPVKEKVKQQEHKSIRRTANKEAFDAYLALAKKKNWKGRLRLLEALAVQESIPWMIAQKQLDVTAAVLKPLLDAGIVEMEAETVWRDPVSAKAKKQTLGIRLNEEQQAIADDIMDDYLHGRTTPCLIHGITGSGKTEVYMELIERMVEIGKSAIVLIPEISLTYQTMMRFYARFGDLVSIVNSRLSQGEKYDQFERARRGEIRIMIGPRSALFTPFNDLGLIVIDEEQESAYKSEQIPKYHARETAIERARLCGALVVMGSATPSMESYSRAQKGLYRLYTLTRRGVEGSELADVSVVDLRTEMQEGNRSIFSRLLQKKMEDCLAKNQQIMLFLNRRGYSKAVSCRSCGKPVGCPHCAVPLTEHVNGKLICHYCGFTRNLPKNCPSCGSPYLAGFGMGTQKVEMMVKERFPGARVLRMDYDTTSGKDGHEQILQAFASHEADILVGTQMIVKGLDFPNVTLVGILAADMSLYGGDFRSHERTYQLLTQAAGRAGRGKESGTVIIQTYDPDNYSIKAAAAQEYGGFFTEESRFRRMMAYPPEGYMCEIMTACESQEHAKKWIEKIAALINQSYYGTISMIGPSEAPVAKVRDYWRYHMFLKTLDHERFVDALDMIGRLDTESRKEGIYLSVTAL